MCLWAQVWWFQKSSFSAAIEHHAEYILRKGSKDLGSHTLEGSRPGMAMLVYAALHVISRPGYEMLINTSIEKAHYFAQLIEQQADFELVTQPELCLLTYRYNPSSVQALLAVATEDEQESINNLLDKLTKFVQKRQRENGKSFVSRTRIEVQKYNGRKNLGFSCGIGKPVNDKNNFARCVSRANAISTRK